MWSIASSGVQRHFCTIAGSQGIRKKICGIRFQEFEKINNLISFNLNPPWFFHDFQAMNILEGWEISHFKDDILRHVSCSNPFLYKITEPKNKQNDMRHEILRLYLDCPISEFFRIWYPILICLYLDSLKLYRNVFVL